MGGKGVRYTWPVGVYERKGEEGGRGAKAERDGEEKETCGREERRGRRWDRGWGGGGGGEEEKGAFKRRHSNEGVNRRTVVKERKNRKSGAPHTHCYIQP